MSDLGKPIKRRSRMSRTVFTVGYIESNSIPVPESGCWLWLLSRDPCGYGKAFMGKREVGAHRASFMAFNGDIDGTTHVLHKCDTPSCVNPSHLFPGSHRMNIDDKVRKGRCSRLAGETHPNAKLSRDSVLAIFGSRDKSGSLAKRYGVQRGTVWKIRAGKKWTHITGMIDSSREKQ